MKNTASRHSPAGSDLGMCGYCVSDINFAVLAVFSQKKVSISEPNAGPTAQNLHRILRFLILVVYPRS